MGYYKGDYYAGTRGDPGFFSFVGGLAKKALGFVPGVGPILSTATEAITKAAGSGIVKKSGAILKSGVEIAKAHPVLTAAGAAGATAIGGAAIGRMSAGAPAAAGRAHTRMLGGGGRRRRRMNACNPKALRRAIRRTRSFAKFAMRTIHLVHPQKKARFGGFRKKRAKR